MLALTPVTTLIARRVRLLKLAQHETLPAARVHAIDDVEDGHLRGSVGTLRDRVQVDIFAAEASGVDPYADAAAVEAALYGDGAGSALAFFSGSVGGSPEQRVDVILPAGRDEGYDPDPAERPVVRIRLDYIVHWRH
jgi:hypothetical protein